MRNPLLVLYILMTGWLTIGVALRIWLELTSGYGVDVLPAITAALAVTAIVLLAAVRRVLIGVYIALASWDLVGSAFRVLFQISAHQPLDAIPVVSVAVGVAALIVLFTATPRTTQET